MADKRFRCAVVGCGRISSQHIEGFSRAEGASISALCDVDPQQAKRLAEAHRLHEAAIFSDYRTMLAEIHPDIVSVAVPDAEHPAVVRAVVDSGAHVLCEKPLARDPDEADSLVRFVTSRGVQTGVRMPLRFSPAYRYVRRWIEEGNLGRPFHIRAHLSVGRLSDPDVPIEWRMRRETGGLGALSDLGSHLIDLSFFLLGDWTSDITAVSGVSKIFYSQRVDPQKGTRERVTAPDAAICTVSFASGCLLNLEVSRVSPGDHFYQIDGSEGSVRSDGDSVWAYRRLRTEHQRPESDFHQVPPEELRAFEEPGLFEEFVRSCRTQSEPFHPNFVDGARIVHAAAEIYERLRKEEEGV